MLAGELSYLPLHTAHVAERISTGRVSRAAGKHCLMNTEVHSTLTTLLSLSNTVYWFS